MAEKNSTARKHMEKKAEEPKPEDEVQPALKQIKPQELNWDVIGLSSVAVPLVGAGFLFIVGWAYESNWYEYFNIDVSRLNINIQQYLVQSVVPIVISIAFLVLSASVYQLGKVIYLAIKTPFSSGTRMRLMAREDWLGMTLIYMFFIGQYVFPLIPYSSARMPFEIRILGIFGLALIGVILFALLGLGIAYFVRRRVQRRLTNANQSGNPVTFFDGISQFSMFINSPLVVGAIAFVYLFFTMSIASSLAVSHASKGAKFSLLSVQKVYLISTREITFLHNVVGSCDPNGSCMYGPFGLVAENADSFYMIAWRENNIPFHPGLFIFPRTDPNNAYIVMPVSTIVITPPPTPTSTQP